MPWLFSHHNTCDPCSGTEHDDEFVAANSFCIPFESTHPVRAEVSDRNGRKLTMVVMPMKDCGDLVNRIDHTALHQVTERLKEVAGQLESIEQRKKQKIQATREKAEKRAA